MRKKGGNFFEEHVEKMVLVLIGLVCMWLLITRVLISPNKVEYGGEKLGPGEIDIRISKEAEDGQHGQEGREEGESTQKDRTHPWPGHSRVDLLFQSVQTADGDIGVYCL